MISTLKAARTTGPAWLLTLEWIGRGRRRLLAARGYAGNDLERLLESFTADFRELSIGDARAYANHLQLTLFIDVPEHDRSRPCARALPRRNPRSCNRSRAVPRSAIRNPRPRCHRRSR